MKRPSYILVFAVAAALRSQTTGSPPFGKRQALIIGNQNYETAVLQNPINDAGAIASRLSTLGFTVTTVLDAKLPQISTAVDSFTRSLNENDVALFYYSGHGFQLEGDNYLIPVDFNARSESDAKYAAYSVSRILDKMSSKRTRLNVLILDSCRDNPFLATRSSRGGWAAMNTTAGTLIAFATAPGSTASDNPADRNGLFTKHLLNELQRPRVGLQELFDRVRRDVYLDSNKTQLPWTASSLIDDFQFDSGANDPAGALGLSTNTRSLEVQTSPASSSWPKVVVIPPGSTRAEVVTADNAPQAAALVTRATEELRKNELTNALDDLDKAIQLRLNYPEAYRSRGRVELLLKKHDQAIADLSYCVQTDPSDVTALYYRSLALNAIGQYDAAIKDATEIIRQAPAIAEAYVARASGYLAEGRLGEAVQDSSNAIDRNPNLSIAYAVRGRAFQGLGKIAEARSDFSQASLAQRQAASRQ